MTDQAEAGRCVGASLERRQYGRSYGVVDVGLCRLDRAYGSGAMYGTLGMPGMGER